MTTTRDLMGEIGATLRRFALEPEVSYTFGAGSLEARLRLSEPGSTAVEAAAVAEKVIDAVGRDRVADWQLHIDRHVVPERRTYENNFLISPGGSYIDAEMLLSVLA